MYFSELVASVNNWPQTLGALSHLVASVFVCHKVSAHHQFANGTYFTTSALVLKFSAFLHLAKCFKKWLFCLLHLKSHLKHFNFYEAEQKITSIKRIIKQCKIANWRVLRFFAPLHFIDRWKFKSQCYQLLQKHFDSYLAMLRSK